MSPAPTAPDAASAPADGVAAEPARVIARARERGIVLATAESLTAGALVARLVDVPGASAVVAGGAACYSCAAKTRVLGVDAALLADTGAVTSQVAAAMAEGALALYEADLAVSTTGVAGPGPDERGIAEGTVFLGLARRSGPTSTRELRLSGGRAVIRSLTVEAAVAALAAELGV
ncbi:nicotinamide-nucleotide amidohydrolase family protein [Brachybacterium sp. AOP43-C2-M15]|uniref:nicotinamide-nucleotide amidohydrolase family protein n=1 Tax=Brachybacterium sp. AOP43-C2-M15 TaxID=3457661 RepID=UPI004034DBFA